MIKRRIQLLPALLLVIVAITIPSAGCARNFKRIEPLYPTSGGPGAQMYVAFPLGSNGTAKMTLPDGVVLEGEWAETSGATDLDAVLLTTPASVISAADLAGSERPTVIVTLSGQDIQMICIYIGDPESDYEVTCADSDGVRWRDRRGTQWKKTGGWR